MRIGVIADTHVPDRVPALTEEIREIFANVDLILHAGDISVLPVLQQLEEITITIAVAGNRDSDQLKSLLQSKTIVDAAGKKIGLIHGEWGFWEELPTRIAYALGDRHFNRFHEHIYFQFEEGEVDCIVFGHSHHPFLERWGNVLMFNPGAVVPAPRGSRPSVGILEITERGIEAQIVPLRHRLRDRRLIGRLLG